MVGFLVFNCYPQLEFVLYKIVPFYIRSLWLIGSILNQ
jgi:hypothetical protein